MYRRNFEPLFGLLKRFDPICEETVEAVKYVASHDTIAISEKRAQRSLLRDLKSNYRTNNCAFVPNIGSHVLASVLQ